MTNKMESSKLTIKTPGVKLSESVLSAPSQKSSLIDRTILTTPIPVIASTLRSPLKENSINLSTSSSLKLSQLRSCSTVSYDDTVGQHTQQKLANIDRNRSLGFLNCKSTESCDKEFTEDARSSLGLIPSELIAGDFDDLLSSVKTDVWPFVRSKENLSAGEKLQFRNASQSLPAAENMTPRTWHEFMLDFGENEDVLDHNKDFADVEDETQKENTNDESELNDSVLRRFHDLIESVNITDGYYCEENDVEDSQESYFRCGSIKGSKFYEGWMEAIAEETETSHMLDMSAENDSEKPDRLDSIYFRRSGGGLLNESDSEVVMDNYDRESAVESGLEPLRLSAQAKSCQSLLQVVQKRVLLNVSGSNVTLNQSKDIESSFTDVQPLRSSDATENCSDLTLKGSPNNDTYDRLSVSVDGQDQQSENQLLDLIQSVNCAANDYPKSAISEKEKKLDWKLNSGNTFAVACHDGEIDSGSAIYAGARWSIDERNPVYKDDNGEWVTDLAYQHPLRNSFENIFKGRCSNADPGFTSFASNSDEFVLSDSEFKSGKDCLDMFQTDQKKFEAENPFIQDAMNLPTNGCGDSVDNWSFHSQYSHLFDPSLVMDDTASYLRISIGTFIGLRTEDLGSLDGSAKNRPTFGTKITTPPSVRRPIGVLREEDPLSVAVMTDSDMTLTASDLVSSVDSCSKKSQAVGSLPYEVSCTDEQPNSISRSLSFSELNATARHSSNGQKSSEMSDFSVSHLTSGSQRNNKKSDDCGAKRKSVKKSVNLTSLDMSNIGDATSVKDSKTSKSSDQLPILPDLQCISATFDNGNSTSLKTSVDLDVCSRNCSLDCSEKTSSLKAVTDFNTKLLGSDSEKELLEATYKASDVSFGALPDYLLENRKSRQSSSAVKASRELKSSGVSQNLPSSRSDASQLGCVERDLVVASTSKVSLEENRNSCSGLVRSNLTSSSTKRQANSVSEEKKLPSLKENQITSGRDEKKIGNSRPQSFERSLNSSDETSNSESSAEQPTVLNITEIAQRISLSSESGNDEDLAKFIALMSLSQSTGKHLSQPKVYNEVDSISGKVETKSAGKIEVDGINDNNKNLFQLKKNVGNKETVSEKAGSINNSQAELGSRNLRANVPSNESAKPSCNGPIKEPSVIVSSFEKPANPTRNAGSRLLSDDCFNFRSPRQSLAFSHSKRRDLEQSVLANSFVSSEISFASSTTDQHQKHSDKSVSKKEVLPLPAPVNHGNLVDISADLGQTVKRGFAVTKPALEQQTSSNQRADNKPESMDAVGCKRNSTCTLARSYSYQQAVASGENLSATRSRIVESTLNGHPSSVLQRPLVSGTISKKDESVSSDKSLNDVSTTIVPSQEINKDVAFFPLSLSDTTSFVTSMSGPGRMPNRLSTGPLNGSHSETSHLIPVTENAATMQLSQYLLASGDPSQKISTDVSLMTSRLSLSGIDNSLAIDLFTQSTPMVKTSFMPDVCNTAPYNSRSVGKPLFDPINLVVPSELLFKQTSCIGVSAENALRVSNPSPHVVRCQLNVTSVSVNRHSYDPSVIAPFIIKQVLLLQPFSSEDVKVSFAPKFPGSFVAHLAFVSERGQQISINPVTTVIKAVAEKPNIQFVASSDLALDFGAMPWGKHKILPITIVNKGYALVPIRLFASTTVSSVSCFFFAHYDADTTNANANFSSQCSCVLHGIGPNGNDSPVTLLIAYRAPDQPQNGTGIFPIQEVLGMIEIEVDVPSLLIPLEMIQLKGRAGTAKIHSPEQMDNLTLKAGIGTGPQTQVIPLRNAGNIPIEVSLEMSEWSDMFTVSPMQLMIEPGGQTEVCVRFEPAQSAIISSKFESSLLMIIEPDGPAFENRVIGEVLQMASSRELSRLCSNRSFISWGGVPVGSSEQEMICLKNSSDQLLKLFLEIRNSQDFKLVSNYGRKDKTATSKEIVIKPNEEFTVTVLFAPKTVGGASGKLHIRPIGTSMKYSVPLYGYGGLSELIIEDLQFDCDLCYHMNVEFNGGRDLALKSTLRNVGARAAFVTAHSFQDLMLKNSQPTGKFLIQPNEFCLLPNQRREVAILVQLTDRDICSHLEHPNSLLAVLGFFYGDEVSRKQYRKALNRGCRISEDLMLSNKVLKKIQFDVCYKDENCIREDITEMADTPDDITIFYKKLRKMSLAISLNLTQLASGSQPIIPFCPAVAVPQTSTVSTTAPHSITRSGIHESISGCDSPPVKDPSLSLRPVISRGNKRSVTFDDVTLNTVESSAGVSALSHPAMPWKVEPEELNIIYNPEGSRPEAKQLCVVNNTDSVLKFEISWPVRCLSVVPEHGSVQPNSSLLLNVSAIADLGQKEIALPWSGVLHITCNGESKMVCVKISAANLLPTAAQESGVSFVKMSATSQQQTALVIAYPTSPVFEADNKHSVKYALNYSTTFIGQAQDLLMEIKNESRYCVNWVISGISPPFIRPPGDSEGVFGSQIRVLQTIFSMQQSNGRLEAEQKTRILVRFRPHQAGAYFQYYDLKFERLDAPDKSSSYRLNLFGESKKNEAFGVSNSTIGIQGISAVTNAYSAINDFADSDSTVQTMAAPPKPKSKEGGLSYQPKMVEFGNAPELKSQVKVKISNSTATDQVIEILPPHAPFFVEHSSITVKANHFLNLPVILRPEKSGNFHGVLVLKAKAGDTFVIQLHAEIN